ncbi:hypothetical protein [Spirosoma endbachense]|uniref:Uncharacterized protein n=1 Tax=Spirosoma endbachense TaxID=2666025 RepID=A0A6P1W5C7_9BACT|nr:hypothetical protein [Spirosoma endbachense]QHV99229.1 hypothetical protein GJR95_31320 [Spirosoma endbachense]
MPQYVEKYYAEFIEQPNKGLGLFPALYKISFRFPDFSGTPTKLQVYKDSPVKISKSTSDSSRLAFWHPLKADFKLRASNAFESREFYVRSDRDIQVVILKDTTATGFAYTSTVFAGWLLPADFSERYGKKPYPISVSASCGLSTLKDRPILDPDGKRLQGYVSKSTVIRTALYNSGLELPLITGVNLFERASLAAGQLINGKANPASDPLFTTQMQAEALVSDSGETLSCYDALKKVLEPMGVRLGQAEGKWFAIRADEITGEWDVWNQEAGKRLHTRTYTSSDLSAGPDINSDVSRDMLIDIYPNQTVRVKNEDPTLRLLGIKPGVKVVQQFGRYLNYLKNGDWASVDSTFLPTNWTRNNITADNSFRVGLGNEEDQYGMVLYGAGDEKANADTPSIRTRMIFEKGSLAYTQSYKRTLKCKFELHLIRAAKIVVLAYRDDSGNNDGGEYILQGGGTWKRAPSRAEMVGLLTYNANEAGTISFPGISSITLPMNALDRVRMLDIWVCVGEALDLPGGGPNLGTPGNRPFVKYYNVTLETEKDGVNLESSQVVITDSKRKLDATATLTLGDVPWPLPNDRIGSLFRAGSHEPTVDWNRGDAGDATGKPLTNWLAESLARQTMQPSEVIEVTLMGRLPYGLHTGLRFLDIGRSGSGQIPLQSTNLSVEFQSPGFGNYVLPGVYLPWIKVGMQVTIMDPSGANSGTYTVTSYSGLVKDPWFFTVDGTLTPGKSSGVAITDTSTIDDGLFTPYIFQQTRMDWDVRGCEIVTSASRVMDLDVEQLPMPKGYWADKDGNLIPLALDDNDQPVPPALKTTLSETEQFQRNLQGAGLKAKLGISSAIRGYTPIETGKAKLGADVFTNGIKVGSVIASLRRQISLMNP